MIRLHDYNFVVVNSRNKVKDHELTSAWNMKYETCEMKESFTFD